MDIDFGYGAIAARPCIVHQGLRPAGGVFWSASLQGWVVTSYDLVKAVFSDSARFASEGTPIAQAFGNEAMLVIDSPLHHKMRAVWAKPTSVSGIAAMGDEVSRVATALLSGAADRLRTGETVDLVKLFEAFTSEIITFLMDVPRDRADDIQQWNRIITDTSMLVLDECDPRFHLRKTARDNVFALLRGAIEDRVARFGRGEQPQDLVALMVAATGRDGITSAMVLDNLMNLLLGALDTTVKWLGNSVVILAGHPDVDADVRRDRSLIPVMLEESLRYETVVQLLMRVVRVEAVEFGGATLKQGDLVYILPGAANSDPVAFESPTEFRMDRKAKLAMGFGFGMHQCLGMNLARKEAQIFMNHLFDLLPSLAIVGCDYGESWMLRGPLRLTVKARDLA